MISIVINNFNYERYLAAAIESALGQTCPATEVLVVDDGSTDGSRSVIAQYGGRIHAIFKPNGGQPSAFNAGLAAARGDVVIFLDADDLLLPETADRVLAEFRRNPRLVNVQYRLEVVDAAGRSTDRFIPMSQKPLASGDLRKAALTSPDDIVYAPTSGNAFSAAALQRLFPIPDQAFADMYLVNLAALLGPFGSIEEVGGHYRVHGRNAFHRDSLDLEGVQATIKRTEVTHCHLLRLAAELGLIRWGAEPRLESVTNLAQRLMSLRLDPARHPIVGDRRLKLAYRGALTSLRRGDLRTFYRLAYCVWFAAAALAPRPVAHAVSSRLFAAWRS